MRRSRFLFRRTMGNRLVLASRSCPAFCAGAAAATAVVALLAATRGRGGGGVTTLATVGEHFRFAHLHVGATKVLSWSPSGSSVILRNLRPILPGHVVAASERRVARLEDLREGELLDLVESVRSVQNVARAQHGATAFNLALKDGDAAGQPVPHVHMHLVPRRPGDLAENDLVYELIDRWSPIDGHENIPPPLEIPPDDLRNARSQSDMAAEATRYASAAAADLATSAALGPLPAGDVAFGSFNVKNTQVFFCSKSGLSLAIVNLKPLCPGHVLVIPRRVVPLLSDLTAEEHEDLWRTVRHVQALVQRCHGATSSNLGVQDGRDAGQSVPHVHVHILPRAPPATRAAL
eukprot:TRINITY_DN48650_c0_g1_i1.p1 TRINITY_DN48650_c0_g1~~TRINITY_DN48650_c0_g1_i1.p1  ORF type:complete len:349 (-),score=66.34 TRINITY_DN48650_c0_g1_i1:66-1112(-)